MINGAHNNAVIALKENALTVFIHQRLNAFSGASSPELHTAAAAARCVCCELDSHRLYNDKKAEVGLQGSGGPNAGS